jgi:hypothetical protein
MFAAVQLATCRVARDRFVCLSDGHPVDLVRDASDGIAGFLNSGYRYARDERGCEGV